MSRYIRPATLAEAVAALAEPQATLLAGGTELYRAPGPRPSGLVIDLAFLESLREIAVEAAGVRLGALVRWSDLLETELPAWILPLLQAAKAIASPQVRHAGTLGGNLSARSGERDGAVALLVLDARVALSGPAGERELPLARFLERAPGASDLLTHVLVPTPTGMLHAGFRKLGLRRALGPAVGAVAAGLAVDASATIRQARLAVGAPGLTPCRLPTLEERLHGRSIGEDLAAFLEPTALAMLHLRGDGDCGADYRRHALAVLLRRLLADLRESR